MADRLVARRGIAGEQVGCGQDHAGRAEAALETVVLDKRALERVQLAFVEHHGLQCGFCTPGVILTAADLLSRDASPSDETIRHALRGNLCRCTGYQGIVESIRAAGGTS